MAIRILQFGTTGQLGLEILRLGESRSDIALRGVTAEEADFRYPEQIAAVVRSSKDVDMVVNAVAYTAVDKAESEEDLARLINATSVAALADACAVRRIPLIHVSTDYVFDGSKLAPYVETNDANPLGVYGRTKREGELAIEAVSARHVIIRTSWLYSAHGTNFVKTMLRLGSEREELRIVEDQRGAPTSAANLAETILVIAQAIAREPDNAELFGIFHYSDAGETTWRHFAEEIFAQSGLNPRVIPVRSHDYVTPARRPLNSRLDCSKVEKVFGVRRQDWRAALKEVLKELSRGRI